MSTLDENLTQLLQLDSDVLGLLLVRVTTALALQMNVTPRTVLESLQETCPSDEKFRVRFADYIDVRPSDYL